MERSELLAIAERLCDAEIDMLDRDELAEVVAAAARVRGWLDATDVRCARRGRKLADAGRAEPSSSLLSRTGKRSGRDANQIERRDKVAEAMPSFEDGLDDGTVSAGHLDAIANATRNAPPEVRAAFAAHEDELLSLAAGDTVEAFTRRCRALVAQLTAELTGNDASELDRQRADSSIRTWVDAESGMHHTHTALDPLRHEILWNAINRSLRRRQQIDGNARTPWNQMQVDALIDAVRGGAPENPRRHRPTTPASGPTSSTPPPGAASNTPPRGAASSTPPPGVASNPPPPSPAGDIARNLADAIDRSMAHTGHQPTCDHEPPQAAGTASSHAAAAASHAAHDTHDTHDRSDIDDWTAFDAASDTAPIAGDEIDDVEVEESSEIEEELRRIELRLPEISVLVGLDVLTTGLHAHGICETEDGIPLPVSTIRRLCCDAEIIPIVLRGDGVALDVGRTARTVNRAQRRALRAMHRTCAHPDCTVPFSHTKIHHIRWWVRDRGPTDIDNLLPLCERHHHLVHEGGWGLTMTPDRIATWTRPDGIIAHHGSTIDRSAEPPPATPCTLPDPPGR